MMLYELRWNRLLSFIRRLSRMIICKVYKSLLLKISANLHSRCDMAATKSRRQFSFTATYNLTFFEHHLLSYHLLASLFSQNLHQLYLYSYFKLGTTKKHLKCNKVQKYIYFLVCICCNSDSTLILIWPERLENAASVLCTVQCYNSIHIFCFWALCESQCTYTAEGSVPSSLFCNTPLLTTMMEAMSN